MNGLEQIFTKDFEIVWYITAIAIVILGFLSRAFRWFFRKSFGRIGKMTKMMWTTFIGSSYRASFRYCFLLFGYASGWFYPCQITFEILTITRFRYWRDSGRQLCGKWGRHCLP